MFLHIIGDIARENNSVTVCSSTQTKEVVSIFNERNIQSIVVLDNQTVVGLVMRDHLFYRLGSQFGYNLYMKKRITKVMDTDPLIVDYNDSVFRVSNLAMNRPQEKIYDSIIVCKDNYFHSIISIKNLLLEVSKLKIKEARNANPLTGLPGNYMIELKLREKIKEKEIFSLLYIDLDNFKAYNDNYGYQKGDQILKFTASILRKTAKEIAPDSFIGHIGGDDFVVITNVESDRKFAERVIEKFDKNVKQFFNKSDIEKGYITCLDRQKRIVNTPLTSISIAIISNEFRKIENYLEVSDRAAEIKKLVKEKIGSNFLKDRRENINV
ncbi:MULTISPECIES: GGDEF domain-containing protein [unclassified Halanaerobium]|uniref:GGDEF domain-containing protein n=1 Tax=unclassified Halanaerobium TaxID=2641197 RepID=UPI000E1708F1|nr:MULTISPECIES: GGDEF domain-containing protein [unclassified Halanaerobium]RCW50778.1 diguanylate cyclase (GGDEF)-like protein [Halanaerobium sp. MA284_MarDTE_T2]RCW84966.1 diguanylate cyclase (GGDEF)-like protein [Halanaerobium sp. DL-01]